MSTAPETETSGLEIAIVGMAGRFPGAGDIDAFWRNVRDGVESIESFDEAALRARGVPERTLSDPAYVRAGATLDGIDRFDAGFFGFSPRDAEMLDPQQRVFLETAWEALEHAGYAGASRPGAIGVYAGSGTNLYLLRHLLPSVDWSSAPDISALLTLTNGNAIDSLTTLTAYKLNLRGPAISLQTACSTSLVTVHLACRSLLHHEADMALAGGVWINLLQDGGYRYQAGSILSPDGRCRAFDAKAAGTIIGSGVAIVVLRRLEDALASGDTIHAVIRGSSVNNDGSAKVGYTAPSVEAQAEVIRAAHALSATPADTIGYVEAHGTGTALGDPIEVAALTQAFRASSARRGFCALGSVKTNVGHLDAAAGVTGLIKAALALKYKTLPPSLNFERPNPQIDFDGSPFYVNTAAKPWPKGATPRRAGVSSFGIGGTNAHVILEEAPARAPESARAFDPQLLMLSARSATALQRAERRLAEHIASHPQQSLADVAHTLRVGRARFEHRAAALCPDREGAVRLLQSGGELDRGRTLSENPGVAFLFPGQGAQRVHMGSELYESEPEFRAIVDDCAARLRASLGVDLRELVFARGLAESEAAARLEQTAITQAALFVIEYGLARLWMSRGVRPDSMMGHSVGEYVAACLSGVFTLDAALTLVAARGRLLQATQPGAMLAISLPQRELGPFLDIGCDLAAVNAVDRCVLSGPNDVIAAVERAAAARGAAVRRLRVSHAFHSVLMEPVLDEFASIVSRLEPRAPEIPFVSNVSGRWITGEQARSAAYWAQHVRATVRFHEGLGALLAKPDRVLLEVGPGETLCKFARQHEHAGAERPLLATQPAPGQGERDRFLRCAAQLWVSGVEVDVEVRGRERRRVPLPTYPFERRSYWIEAPREGAGTARTSALPVTGRRDVDDWFYVPVWKRAEPLVRLRAGELQGCVLILSDDTSLSRRLAAFLREEGARVVCAEPALEYAHIGEDRYALRPGERGDHELLLRAIESDGGPVTHVCHLLCVDPSVVERSGVALSERSFFSLLALAQALDATAEGERQTSITVVASQLEDVMGVEALCPDKATLHGPCKVIPQEHPSLRCKVVDVLAPETGHAQGLLVEQIAAELRAGAGETLAAYRGPHRWLKSYESTRRDPLRPSRLRRSGCYVITGGLGGVGRSLAQYLAQSWQAKLVLLGRSALPPRADWEPLATDVGQPEALRQKLQTLLELERMGAQVMAVQADVCDRAQVRGALDQARERFGVLHGVIHAAGVAGGGVIASKTRGLVDGVFAPKLEGTRALMSAIAPDSVDFVLLCSSLTAVTGGFGQVDYCAANCFLDAFAADMQRREGAPLVVSVNWDAWREVGMAAGQQLPDELGIAPAQGGQVFARLLCGSAPGPQSLVSTIELDRQFAQMQMLDLAELIAEPSPARRVHERPALRTPFEAPATELERDLAALWSEFTGIAPIGIHDSLFELGGDSLLAVQLLARIHKTYGVELNLASFFKTPSVAALAALIESKLIDEIEAAASAQASS